MISSRASDITMTEIGDPALLAAMHAQQQRFRRNSDWLQAHISSVYARHRGKYICVAGDELFVADTTGEVVAQARAAHPDDNGLLLRYIPRERMERIYAH